jgi:hypothetical protein
MTDRHGFSAVPPADWDALPLPVRIADRLAEALLLASELRADLCRAEAEGLRWIAPEMDEILLRLDRALQRFAS